MVVAVITLALVAAAALGVSLWLGVSWRKAVAQADAEVRQAEQLHRNLELERDARKRDYDTLLAERDYLTGELAKVRAARDAAETPKDRNDRLGNLLGGGK